MTEETVALRRALIESVFREIFIAREESAALRQKAASTEDRLTYLLRELIKAGVKLDNERRDSI